MIKLKRLQRAGRRMNYPAEWYNTMDKLDIHKLMCQGHINDAYIMHSLRAHLNYLQLGRSIQRHHQKQP